MKKLILILTAVLLAFGLLLPAAAEAETLDETAEIVETPADGAENEAPVERFFTLFLAHFSDIAVAAAALWLAFPKWGGVAVLIRLLRHIRTYFDDAGNSGSVYNVLAANADAMARFMNDAAPLLADLREGREALLQAQAALAESEELTAGQTELLAAAHRSLSLLAAELCRVVSALPDTDEATRARFAALADAVTGEAAQGEAEHEKTDLAV